MILGLDFGSTTTKIVLMDGTEIKYMNRLKKEDSYIDEIKKIGTDQISLIALVGAGASFIEEDILGIPTKKVEEFQAVSVGGHFLSKLDECMVVSLGTGTSFMYVNSGKRIHAGGSGIGGGLLSMLAKERMPEMNLDDFFELAKKGSIEKSDLLIKDISKDNIGSLMDHVTVANMAKLNKLSTPEDYAFGVCNMVFQNIGVMSVMADSLYKTKKVVVMGTITQSDVCKSCLTGVGNLFGYEFVIPDNSGFGVCIGAILLVDPNYESDFSSVYNINMDHLEYTIE